MKKSIKKVLSLLLSTVLLASCTFGAIKTNIDNNKKQDLEKQDISKNEVKFDYKNATIYFAMTDRFNNGNTANDESYGRKKVDAKASNVGTFQGGDFKGITEKLKANYFNEIGINVLWISAPYEQIHGFISGGDKGEFAHYGYHGYYALDWTSFDKNFGTSYEFEEMVDEAHRRGIRVVLDIVMNHTGYSTLKDMGDYNYGKLSTINYDWQPDNFEDFNYYQKYIDYSDEKAWSNWWGKDFVRASVADYDRGNNEDKTMVLYGLPDIKTESDKKIPIPKILQTKWEMEKGKEFDPWKLKSTNEIRLKTDLTAQDYLITWISAWVKDYGIDGFRVDTAKHVDLKAWEKLKKSADESLKLWRKENPNKPGANFTEDFFMFGEVWGAGIEKNEYHDNGFDALLNFTFQGENGNGPAEDINTMPNVIKNYAEKVNGDNPHNIVSYISSHDTKLFNRKKLKDGITYQMLLPGAVQVFYGDETARSFAKTLGNDKAQVTRGFMNWESIDTAVFDHFKKLSNFRKRNLSIGLGTYKELSSEPYVFLRSYKNDNYENKVIVSINFKETKEMIVSEAFKDGDIVHEAYNGTYYKVRDGKITITPNESGIVLLEKLESK